MSRFKSFTDSKKQLKYAVQSRLRITYFVRILCLGFKATARTVTGRSILLDFGFELILGLLQDRVKESAGWKNLVVLSQRATWLLRYLVFWDSSYYKEASEAWMEYTGDIIKYIALGSVLRGHLLQVTFPHKNGVLEDLLPERQIQPPL